MVNERATPRIGPLVAGVVLLALVIAVGILPNTGAVPAASNCPYGVCTNSSPSTSSWLIVLGVLALIALALLVLILRGRRRPQPSAQEWEAGPSTAGGPGGAGSEIPEGAAAGVVGGTALGGAAAAYVESPEDVQAPEPAPAPATPAGATGSAEEPDIDSLMAELDKISGEILTRGNAPKKPPPSGGSDSSSS